MVVLLDRDGVINVDRPDSVKSLDEFQFIDGAIQAIARLTQAGHRIAIVTNQSVVGKGLVSEGELEEIHAHMCEMLAQAGGKIDAIYACYDHPDHPTNRRKPASGMIEEALRDFAVAAVDTPFVGDALSDLQAAAAAGCQRYLVKTGKGAHSIEDGWNDEIDPVTICDDLGDAVTRILQPDLS